jgi:hypothetical protein
VNHLTWQTLNIVNWKGFFRNILCIESFCPQKNKSMFLFSRTHLKHWNQPLNVCMHVCYLDCHAVGLCCYLVLHIENLLHLLLLFYFHLRPIYWLSLVLYWIQSYYNFVYNNSQLALIYTAHLTRRSSGKNYKWNSYEQNELFIVRWYVPNQRS